VGKCACHPCGLYGLTVEELVEHINKEHVDAFYSRIKRSRELWELERREKRRRKRR